MTEATTINVARVSRGSGTRTLLLFHGPDVSGTLEVAVDSPLATLRDASQLKVGFEPRSDTPAINDKAL
jgi:hypothetical protein